MIFKAAKYHRLIFIFIFESFFESSFCFARINIQKKSLDDRDQMKYSNGIDERKILKKNKNYRNNDIYSFFCHQNLVKSYCSVNRHVRLCFTFVIPFVCRNLDVDFVFRMFHLFFFSVRTPSFFFFFSFITMIDRRALA